MPTAPNPRSPSLMVSLPSSGSLLTILSLGGLTITPPVKDSSPFMLSISSSLSAATVPPCLKWNPRLMNYGHDTVWSKESQTLSAFFFQNLILVSFYETRSHYILIKTIPNSRTWLVITSPIWAPIGPCTRHACNWTLSEQDSYMSCLCTSNISPS